MIRRSKPFTHLLFLFLLFSLPILAADDDWRPVTQAELEMKTPKVEPKADAEAIFWEVRVDDDTFYAGLSRLNYVRVKIFTERGREMFSKYDIISPGNFRIKDVEARVTRPDGSVILLKKEDVFERNVVKWDGFKLKAKSFALPGLEIGSILEYRYREYSDFGFMSMPLTFQRDIPVQTISYYVRRYRGRAMMYAQGFNVGDTWFVDDRSGFKRATMNNLPAFRREPDMGPENELRSWMHLYYSFEENVKKPEEYWKDASSDVYNSARKWMKVDDDVKQAAAEATAGAATDEEKLRRLYEFTQQRIRNLSYGRDVKPEERKQVEGEISAPDTLKLKMGNPGQIDVLFGALARAAGLDARLAFTGDRNDLTFDPKIASVQLMMKSTIVAVKTSENWRFFDPGNLDIPFGMVGSNLEGQIAVVTDPKELLLKDIPVSPAERSAAKRTGKFKLSADGTLEGEARIEFTGHWAAYQRSVNRFDSMVEQEKRLREYVRSEILGTAEIEAISIANVENDKKPFIYSFKLKVPNYAARVGKRLIFQPGIFERSTNPRYTAGTRLYEIFLPYAWSEQDDFTIELPAGFSLESAESPAKIADKSGIGSDDVRMAVGKDGKNLFYQRRFSFGNNASIRFPVDAYPVLKEMFESFNKADTHQLTLKEGAASE